MGQVFVFHVNIFKLTQIQGICKTLGHTVTQIKKEAYDNKLGEIAGFLPSKKVENINNQELSEEMMLFVGLDSKALDQFLAAYKKAGIPPIMRKAVMTPANSHWTVYQLFKDLDEHVRG